MTCLKCQHWNPKASGRMGLQRFAVCNLQVSKAVFFPPHHTCVNQKNAAPMVIARRLEWAGKFVRSHE